MEANWHQPPPGYYYQQNGSWTYVTTSSNTMDNSNFTTNSTVTNYPKISNYYNSNQHVYGPAMPHMLPISGNIMPSVGPVLPNPGYPIPNPGYVMPNPGYMMPNSGHLFPYTRHMVTSDGLMMPMMAEHIMFDEARMIHSPPHNLQECLSLPSPTSQHIQIQMPRGPPIKMPPTQMPSSISEPVVSSRVIAPPASSTVIAPPASSRVIAPPASSRVIAPPASSRVIAPPASSRVIAPPASSRVIAPPASSRVIAPPASSTVIAPPASSTVIASPASSRVIAPPASSRVIAPPASSRVIAPPASSRVIAPPASSRVIAPPASSTVIAPPASSTVIAPPASSTVIAPPASSRVIAPPASSTVIAPPASSRVIAPPASSTVIAPPASSTVIAPPASSTVIAPPASSTVIAPPASSRVIARPVSSKENSQPVVSSNMVPSTLGPSSVVQISDVPSAVRAHQSLSSTEVASIVEPRDMSSPMSAASPKYKMGSNVSPPELPASTLSATFSKHKMGFNLSPPKLPASALGLRLDAPEFKSRAPPCYNQKFSMNISNDVSFATSSVAGNIASKLISERQQEPDYIPPVPQENIDKLMKLKAMKKDDNFEDVKVEDLYTEIQIDFYRKMITGRVTPSVSEESKSLKDSPPASTPGSISSTESERMKRTLPAGLLDSSSASSSSVLSTKSNSNLSVKEACQIFKGLLKEADETCKISFNNLTTTPTNYYHWMVENYGVRFAEKEFLDECKEMVKSRPQLGLTKIPHEQSVDHAEEEYLVELEQMKIKSSQEEEIEKIPREDISDPAAEEFLVEWEQKEKSTPQLNPTKIPHEQSMDHAEKENLAELEQMNIKSIQEKEGKDVKKAPQQQSKTLTSQERKFLNKKTDQQIKNLTKQVKEQKNDKRENKKKIKNLPCPKKESTAQVKAPELPVINGRGRMSQGGWGLGKPDFHGNMPNGSRVSFQAPRGTHTESKNAGRQKLLAETGSLLTSMSIQNQIHDEDDGAVKSPNRKTKNNYGVSLPWPHEQQNTTFHPAVGPRGNMSDETASGCNNNNLGRTFYRPTNPHEYTDYHGIHHGNHSRNEYMSQPSLQASQDEKQMYKNEDHASQKAKLRRQKQLPHEQQQNQQHELPCYQQQLTREEQQPRKQLKKPRESYADKVKMAQRDLLMDQLLRATYECMVCCDFVRQNDAIWSCSNCYHIFHQKCINRWAKTMESDPDSGWRCPGCQNVNHGKPASYHCFCGRMENPRWNRYNRPHSCGELCDKTPIQTLIQCVHKCSLPCHPGPCPPCPSSIARSCCCGNGTEYTFCGNPQKFFCKNKCQKVLKCNIHICDQPCHDGDCRVCEETVEQVCRCKKVSRTVPCTLENQTTFSCDKTCDKTLNCGNHLCGVKCHVGECRPCELLPALRLKCLCGQTLLKTLINLKPRTSCLDPIPSCGKQCNKLQGCGPPDAPHTCIAICHSGECYPCLLTMFRQCSCTRLSAYYPCSEMKNEFRCKRRCNKRRNCIRHKCLEMCCTLDDHICPLECNRTLSCGLHKCGNLCHPGNCPACENTSFEELHCRCGAATIYPPVPCGTKRPECSKPCNREHECGHSPLHTCHDMPDCPACFVFTEKWCHGKHELRKNVPCHQKELSCGLPCGAQLACGRHRCVQVCHKGVCLKEGQVCRQPCPTVRQLCGHPCAAPCHDGPCPDTPCKEMVKVTCECKHRSVTRNCSDNAREYQRMTTSLLASTMADLQLGHSVDIGDKLMGPKVWNDALKSLECNAECKVIERNRRMAVGLQIKNPDQGQKLMPQYSEFMRKWAKKDQNFVQMVHEKLTELVTLAKQSKQKCRSQSFDVMNREKRQFVHEYCEHFGCSSVSYDDEPKRNVVATASKDSSWLPSMGLLEVIQRKSGHRKVLAPTFAKSSQAVSQSMPLKPAEAASRPVNGGAVSSYIQAAGKTPSGQ